jgi:GTP-binding protein
MYKVLIVGRVNVGKSTLFNLITEKKKAVVSKEPKTTRDRIYGECFWRKEKFILIDIAGFTKERLESKEEILEKEIKKQMEIALNEADLIIFLLDINDEITSEDREIAKEIKKLKKEVILAVNKVDNPKLREKAQEINFLSLGFGEPFLISAANGSGVGDLLDELVKRISKIKKEKVTRKEKISRKKPFKIAIVGKTNVGKSTLVNSILGEERVIVTPLPHTTREPIDTYFSYQGENFILIDTAGIRKKTKIKSEVEKIGVMKSLKMIEKSDVVLLVVDLCERVSHLDRKLADLIKENKKSVILVINKFDLARRPFKEYLNYYQNQFPNLWWAPIVFISAKEKINLDKLFQQILLIKQRLKIKLKKRELNLLLKEVIKKYNFSQKYWREVEIYQEKNQIPTVVLKIPKLSAKEIPPNEAQLNILEKKIREKFELWGVPLEVKARTLKK